jgi:hypothetical protein
VDLEDGRLRAGLRVDLDPDRPAFAGRGVDHDDRSVGCRVAAQVVDPHGLHRFDVGDGFDAGDPHDDHRAGAEPVRGVVRFGFDVFAVCVGGQVGIFEVDPATRRGAGVGLGVVIVGEGKHADRARRRDELAAFGFSRQMTRGGPCHLARERPRLCRRGEHRERQQCTRENCP